MHLFKIFPIALCCVAVSFWACGDDSSSGPADPNDENNPASSDDGQLFHLSSSPKSSSSVPEPTSSEPRGQFVPESSASGDGHCVSEISPNVTIENIETVNMPCTAGSEGWLVLIKDQNKLLTCKDGNWEEKILDDC